MGEQVEALVKSLAPAPRRALTRAIKGPARDKGDLKQLEGPWEGLARLRVGGCRVVFSSRFEGGERRTECLFAERGATIDELFEAERRRWLSGGRPET